MHFDTGLEARQGIVGATSFMFIYRAAMEGG